MDKVDVSDTLVEPLKPTPVQPQKQKGIISPEEMFNILTLKEIRSKDNIDELAKYAVDSFN